MIASWADRYTGIPYRFGGTSLIGADCWGLVRLVLFAEFGIDPPCFDHADADPYRLSCVVSDAIPTLCAERIDSPDLGDLVLLRIGGHPCHVGIIAGDGYMLHTLGKHDSALERYESPKWSPRVCGFYRVPKTTVVRRTEERCTSLSTS